MKIILNGLFLFFTLVASGQESVVSLTVPTLNTGNYQDILKRSIVAGDEGATIRFEQNEFGRAFWNQDSLIQFIINKNGLDSISSAYEVVNSVGEFLKSGIFKEHIGAYGVMATIIKEDSTLVNFNRDFMNITSTPIAKGGDFNIHFCDLTNQVANALKLSMRFALVNYNGQMISEYFDESLKKWIMVDADPQSPMFIPISNGEPLSLEDLMSNPDLVVSKEFLWNQDYSNKFDSILTSWSFERQIDGLEKMERVDREEFNPNEIQFDYFIKLAPNQRLEWTYTVDAVYLDENKCENELVKVLNMFQKGDSAIIVDALIDYSKCLKVDPKLLVPQFAGENPLFADSTFFGINNLNIHSFVTTLPKGVYDTTQVYIPHLIGNVEGELMVNSIDLGENFQLILFDFNDGQEDAEKYIFESQLHRLNTNFEVLSDEVRIQFYSNHHWNFDAYNTSKITVIEGDVEVWQWVNAELESKISSKEN